ncbi:4-hydroxythreonine-4-phosphate dehydrogenase PdxA [Mitsuaria sp. GD03876]|uniref:4-hydroxythreonine-4-phosphate dehydrogenase PdxA n=1 Tax=Mitsuaria sp. GD03876 TaxID=2975399 RepID=UPI00244D0402|nr:4-hydroxythreonine-4-phosphate dehydrogenase PdxA [Mitsuaria sp. GD03876]MDH0863331.1 4-hydroxythreonine-4-phosphate dehydrogenase PdxA [Mitsuaria sp. GD03876]
MSRSTSPCLPPLAITMGDPLGVGPEIVVRLAMASEPAPMRWFAVGDEGCLARAARMLGLPLTLRAIAAVGELPAEAPRAGELFVMQADGPFPADATPGRVDARAGAASHANVQRAIDLALAGEVAGIVTAPINKEALRAAGVPFPGHTEILADRAGTRDFGMLLVNSELRVMLVSIHLSLRDAIAAVTVENELRAIRLAHRACQAVGIVAPRVAVAGLNPHAGENGLFGDEDREVIAPAIAAAREAGIDASGPWPGDTVFMRARRGDFDVVVAQYHDQGLIPVKYLGVDEGVNVTVGLPFVRTSVDHGTAFDIAGRGVADAASLACAVRQAAAMVMASPRWQQASDAKPSALASASTSTSTSTSASASASTALPDFIFMLTRQDRTVPDAKERLREVLARGVRHIGFKDIGLPLPVLHELTDAIQAGGALAYLEVVSLDEASEIASARAAVELGVDVLMGGTRPEAVLPILRGTAIRYYPFPGRVTGHPSVLEGDLDEIVASARRIAALDGVAGLDLLAYRFRGDVPALIDAVCAAVDKPVVVAGSIDRRERLETVARSRAAGFTVGTAALDGVFPARRSGLTGQLETIQDWVREMGGR